MRGLGHDVVLSIEREAFCIAPPSIVGCSDWECEGVCIVLNRRGFDGVGEHFFVSRQSCVLEWPIILEKRSFLMDEHRLCSRGITELEVTFRIPQVCGENSRSSDCGGIVKC